MIPKCAIRQAAPLACLVWSAALAAIAEPVKLPAEAVVAGELGRKLDGILTEAQKGGFSGVAFVAKQGEIVLSKGYGFADVENAVPYTAATIFDMGSITKQFTGAAIVQLEEQGKLEFDDPLSKYFPQAPPDKAGITLHQLLTHTAAMKDTFGPDYDPRCTREWFLEKALAAPLLDWKPGERYRYSNSGYTFLALIVEKTSGVAYEEYLKKNIFGPAGMKETGYKLADWSGRVLARGYDPKGKDWGTPLDHPWLEDGPCWNLRGNGGLLASVGDLYRWHLALEGDAVLSAEARRKFQTGYAKEGPNARSQYAYGWSVAETRRGTKLVTHNGGNGIFFADFRRYVDEDVVVIVASNKAANSAEKQEAALLEAIFPKAAEPAG